MLAISRSWLKTPTTVNFAGTNIVCCLERLDWQTDSKYTRWTQQLAENQQKTHTHTHTHPFNGLLSGTTWVSRYQKGKTNQDFTEARDSEWQWHQLGHTQVCISLQIENHASTPPLSFLQARCPSCRPTNSVKALKAKNQQNTTET